MLIQVLLGLLLASFAVSACAGEWARLPSIPDAEGFAGAYAGVSHGSLLVAGGANFPGKKPWESGKKVWYDTVYVLETPDAQWKVAGRLPRPLGYGVSVSYRDGVICAGGSDLKRHYADAFRMEWVGGKLKVSTMRPLPIAVANCCGALVGTDLYVAGGVETPESQSTLKRVFRMDLSSEPPRWTEVAAWPGPSRMLAVAAAFDGAFWLVGGVDLTAGKEGTAQRHYLRDAYRFDPGRAWTRVADLPFSVVAGPSPAPVGAKGIYLLGGDDGAQVAAAPNEHRGFGTKSLRYDLSTNRWAEAGVIVAPRAVLPTAFWRDAWVLPNGEVRPGVRSPEVWSWSPGMME